MKVKYLSEICQLRHILVATQHGNAPRLVAGYMPEIAVTAVTDRIRAARRMNLLPGVKFVIVEENERGSKTMQNAIKLLADEGSIKSGERIVAISGSPLAMRGATSTVRLYRLEADGTISGTEEGSFGCMLELSWGGRKKIVLSSGKKRDFLEDSDTIVFKGMAREREFTVGFGSCSGRIVK